MTPVKSCSHFVCYVNVLVHARVTLTCFQTQYDLSDRFRSGGGIEYNLSFGSLPVVILMIL